MQKKPRPGLESLTCLPASSQPLESLQYVSIRQFRKATPMRTQWSADMPGDCSHCSHYCLQHNTRKDTTFLCRMLSQSELRYWILLRNGLSANFLEETAKAIELNALRIFWGATCTPRSVKSAARCSKEIKRVCIFVVYVHTGTGGAVAHCVGSTHLYTGLAAPEKFPAWKLVASSMAILTSLIATRVPCNQGSCVTRSAPKLMRWPNDNDHDDPDDGDGDGANNDEMNMMRMMRQRDAFFGGFRMFLKTIQLFQYDRFFWCLNLGSWGPSSLCPSLLPMVPSMPRLHDVSTSSTTLAQLSSTCHTPSQPWPMAWQTTCCVLRWKTSPQIFYNPHKSKQNLTTCSVWQKCTRPRHTSLYSPTRLTPPNTLRIQRLIQSNIPMFSSASTCQLHGFMLTVQHVFNNCGCENPYCDTVIYSAVLMEVGTEKESLSSLPIFGDSFRMIKTKRDGTANVWRQRYIIKETVIKKEETYLIS